MINIYLKKKLEQPTLPVSALAQQPEEEFAELGVYADEELKRRQQQIIDQEVQRAASQQKQPYLQPSESFYEENQYERSPQPSQQLHQQQIDTQSLISQQNQVAVANSRNSSSRQSNRSGAGYSLRDLENQYTVLQFKRVGELTGKNVVYDISKLTDEQINRFVN